MVGRENGILLTYTLLEEQALDVLRSKRYDSYPLETRLVIYEEKRKSAKAMSSNFDDQRQALEEIKRRYDDKGKIVGHKLFDRFSHKLPDYLR